MMKGSRNLVEKKQCCEKVLVANSRKGQQCMSGDVWAKFYYQDRRISCRCSRELFKRPKCKIETHTYPKISFHTTGDVHTKSREKFTFLRSKKQSLNEMEKPRLLCMIIPKQTELYPETSRRTNDIEVPVDPFGEKLFIMNLYLRRKDFNFLSLKIRDAIIQVTAVGESVYFQLAVVAYQLDNLMSSPRQTYVVIKKWAMLNSKTKR